MAGLILALPCPRRACCFQPRIKLLLSRSDFETALRGMFDFCVLFFHCCGVSWGGLGLLPLTCRIAWIRPDSSTTEGKELIQEPARIEDGGNPTSRQILASPGRIH